MGANADPSSGRAVAGLIGDAAESAASLGFMNER